MSTCLTGRRKMSFPTTPCRLQKHSAHTSWGPPSIRQCSVALTCRPLFEPQQADVRERAESVVTASNEATRRTGASAETRRIEADIGDVPTQFAHIARRFDLSIIGQFENGSDHPTKNIVIEAARFESGRPVLIVPFIQKDRFKLDNVMACWDGSRASGRRCHAVSYTLRQGERCCCGHSEREKRGPSGYGYRDPSDPSRSKRQDRAHPRQQDRCFKCNPVICSRYGSRSHCHGRVRAFPAAGVHSWRDDTWHTCLDDQTHVDVALIVPNARQTVRSCAAPHAASPLNARRSLRVIV